MSKRKTEKRVAAALAKYVQRRKNPRRKQTKLQRMNAAARASKQRGIATLADKLLKKANPAIKGVMVSVRRRKDGGLTIIPRKVAR